MNSIIDVDPLTLSFLNVIFSRERIKRSLLRDRDPVFSDDQQ